MCVIFCINYIQNQAEKEIYLYNREIQILSEGIFICDVTSDLQKKQQQQQ